MFSVFNSDAGLRQAKTNSLIVLDKTHGDMIHKNLIRIAGNNANSFTPFHVTGKDEQVF